MKTLTLSLLCFAAMATAADNPAPARPMAADAPLTSALFVTNAAQSGMLEVEAGKVALSRANSAEVRTFAQKMVADHEAANTELASLAGARHPLPKQLDAKHQSKLDKLKAAEGAAFDREYGNEMRVGHDEAVKLFTAASTSSAVDAGLKGFAREKLPTLHQHHSLAAALPGERPASR